MKFEAWRILILFLMLPPSIGMAADQAMGRLFFTPEQRSRMDVARQQERKIDLEEEQPDIAPPAASITLNGVITRSDGKTTLWINNRIQSGEKIGPDIALPGRGKNVGQISITTPDARRVVPLKVGQSIDMTSGQVDEAYRHTPLQPQPEKKAGPPNTPDNPGASPESPSRNLDAQDAPEPVDAQAQNLRPDR